MWALALEHLHSNSVGIYGDVLLDRGIEVNRVRVDLGEPLPDWRNYDLLVVMGGGMSAYEDDQYPWLTTEKRTIREAVAAGFPQLRCLSGKPVAGFRAWCSCVQGTGARAWRQSCLPVRCCAQRPGLQGFPA